MSRERRRHIRLLIVYATGEHLDNCLWERLQPVADARHSEQARRGGGVALDLPAHPVDDLLQKLAVSGALIGEARARCGR